MSVEKNPFVIISSVSYTYPTGTVALKNIALNIDQGEMVGIMGPNGAGKTTLIRTLNGLIKPQSGIVLINGENTKDKTIAQLSRTAGVIFQNPDHQLFSNRVEDEIKFSLKSIYSDKSEIQEKTTEILKQFNFERYKNRSPLNLSGGEKKKLALASVVCRDPDILIFDEPTLGQDKKEVEFFTKFIQEERDKGKTIIIITHNVEFAYDYIPRVLLMAKGRLIADGPTREILTNQKLIQEASLVSPQINQFKIMLEKEGIPIPERIKTEEQLAGFLLDYLSDTKSRSGVN
ncbi:MAG: ATP-binding cassette domain-containing protein [Candidatus Lokiarchaeota archaeon]|nr:ATP-binding cassette domain-containing protein [Candidatus Lokiarchaeota archaeon]